MAVTIQRYEIQAALRLGNTPEETEEVRRLMLFASEAVNRHAPNAPTATANEAVVRICAYIYDSPHAGRGRSFANAYSYSGAENMLRPYRQHRAVKVEASAGASGTADSQTPPAQNPIVDVELSGQVLIFTTVDGTQTEIELPGAEEPPGINVRLGLSIDYTPQASELTIIAANGVATIPDFDGELYTLVARRADEPEITSIFYDDGGGYDAFGSFTKHGVTIFDGPDEWAVWVSNFALSSGGAAVQVTVS